MRLFILCVTAFVFTVMLSCKRKNDSKSDNTRVVVDTVVSPKSTPVVPPLRVTYRLLPLNDSLLKTLDKSYDSTRLKTILALNRIDRYKLRPNDTLVVPDTFVTDFNVYAPFPHRVPLLDSVRKFLLCSYPLEAFAAYEHGHLVRWGPTSMGKKSTPTPVGFFHTNWKAKRTTSTVNEEWILDWYFNLTNFGGVSLHQYEMPGYPASHSCVRLKDYDAKWIYYWAEQWRLFPDGSRVMAHGTPVVIYGGYDYTQRHPWRKLVQSPDAFAVGTDSVAAVLKPYVSAMLQQQATRDSVLAGLASAGVVAGSMGK